MGDVNGSKMEEMDQVRLDGSTQTHEDMQGFVDLRKRMFGFMDSLGLRWAVEMGIPDIIAKFGSQTVQDIASRLPSQSPQIEFISRTLNFLAMRGVFTKKICDDKKVRYGLTPISKWLVTDNAKFCVNPVVLMNTHEAMVTSWYRFGECGLRDGVPFQVAHGKPLFSFAKDNPEFGKLFRDGIATLSAPRMKPIILAYGEGFKRLKSLVDVGGGDGDAVATIQQSFPHIKCYNYDLPEVIQDAPAYPGVEHIGGDMFVSVPRADALLLKLVLHNWGDKECINILRNCRHAIPEDGKLLIVDGVVDKNSDGSDIAVTMDMYMLAYFGGKERTEEQWRELLHASGFDRYRFIPLSNPQFFIIEAFF
eukprot:Gb_40575 [translate_table: standard]